MPDWFYRTVSRPLLFRLSAARARDFALGFMGRLARLPLGPSAIDFMGHMRADPRLQRTFFGVRFPTPVGLGPILDGGGVALPALARFGVGFLEVGPVTVEPTAGALERRPGEEAVWSSSPGATWGLDEIVRRIPAKPLGVPVVIRLGCAPGADAERAGGECARMIEVLAGRGDVFSLNTLAHAIERGWSVEPWRDHVRCVLNAAQGGPQPRPVLVVVPADVDFAALERFLPPARELGVAGALIDGSLRAQPSGRVWGAPAREVSLALVRHLRACHGPDLVLVASGGLHEPQHALDMLDAGTDLVEVDTGLIYTGPGLPKRTNEAILATRAEPYPDAPQRPAKMAWFWCALMGAGMFLGSVLALIIAATRVVLPYDEHFVNMTREELHEVNPRLLDFMAHDRVSLAGTMVAIGVLYLGLSLFGVRRGLHWARQSVVTSAFAGFGSFFLFLGFGYFDPFHAFVTGILFQFLLLGLYADLGPPPLPPALDLRGDWRWRAGLWGQLVLVVHACGVLGAGVVIASMGVTQVFVHEDLAFMHTTREALVQANPRLVPFVAHDRATFGGMLVSCGLTLLTCALWGYRPGSAWLWWTMLLAGTAAYAAAIGVHFVVGYTDPWHLTPAFSGLVALLGGLGLSYPFLTLSSTPGSEGAARR